MHPLISPRSARVSAGAGLLLALAALVPSTRADDRQYLLGDWDGTRTSLAAKGITFDFSNTFDFYSNVSGGAQSSDEHFDRQRFTLDADLEKLWGLSGLKFEATGVSQGGNTYGHNRIKVYTNPSGIEGATTDRLGEIYLVQTFGDTGLSLKLGKLDGVGEFGLQELGSTFMNDELNYVPNLIFGSNMSYDPSGKPGAVVAYQDKSGFYAKAGVYAGNDGNAMAHDEHGLSFAVRGPTIYAGEVGYRTPASGLPGVYKLGFHYYDGDTLYLLPQTAVSRNNHLFYANASQTVLWLDQKAGRRIDVGATVGLAPSDRNANATEFTALVRVIGPIPDRPLDELGLGLITSQFSDDYSAVSVAAGGYRHDRETTVELTYKIHATRWLALQPDVQWVNAPLGDSRRSDVLILGFRTVVAF